MLIYIFKFKFKIRNKVDEKKVDEGNLREADRRPSKWHFTIDLVDVSVIASYWGHNRWQHIQWQEKHKYMIFQGSEDLHGSDQEDMRILEGCLEPSIGVYLLHPGETGRVQFLEIMRLHSIS